MELRPPVYPSDITDEQWDLIKSFLPAKKNRGRPRTTELRTVVNAIFYVVRTGCQWRYLPNDFPPWQTVYDYFRKWKMADMWEKLNQRLNEKIRVKEGREKRPSAGVIDSQSVKTAYGGEDRGYDAGKKTKGRKRHLLVDTMGLVWNAVVHTADLQDRDGAECLLAITRDSICKRLRKIWVDGGYRGRFVEWTRKWFKVEVEVVKKEHPNLFTVLPRRWVVERTFGWFNGFRRLSKDYEILSRTSETMIYITMVQLLSKRLTTSR